MGASDYFVGNAPQGASYAAPLIGMQLGQAISQYPQQAFDATQRRRTLSLQQPINDPTTGQPSNDPNTIINELQRRGGAEYSEKLLPFIYGQQADQRAADVFSGRLPGGTTQSTSPPSYATPGMANPQANNPAAAGPANLQRRPNAPPSNNGMNDQGADTLRGIATELSGGREVGQLISGAAQQLRMHPDQPLNPQDAQKVRAFFRNVAMPGGTPNGPQNTPQGAPQNGPQVDNGGGPSVPVGGVAGSPAPAQGAMAPQPPQQQAQAAPFAPRAAQAQQGGPPQDQTLGGLIPQQWVQSGRSASDYRDLLSGIAGQRMISEGARQAALARVKAIDEYMGKLGTQAQESGLKAQEPTPEMKNLASGALVKGEEQKKAIDQSQKTYNGIQAQAAQYGRDLKPYLDLSRGILDDPQFYSGLGAEAVLNWNKVKAVFGAPKAAMLQEALQKVTAGSVLAQINTQRDQLTEAGSTAGRIFQQQVQLVEKAAPQLHSTIAGNRFLVEVSTRLGEQSNQVAQMARDYIQQYGHLDPGFDAIVAQHLTQHPLFSRDELNNLSLIAPPLVRTPQEFEQFQRTHPGEPVRIPTRPGMPGVHRPDGTTVITHAIAPQQPAGPQ